MQASVQIVVQRLVTGGSGEIEWETSRQQLARESVDVDQFVVTPSRRDSLQAAKAQAPSKQEQNNDQ
jgi:hypothetical protein